MQGLMCEHVSGQAAVCVCVRARVYVCVCRDRMGGVITVFSVEGCLCFLKPSVSQHFLCLQAIGVCRSETKLYRKSFLKACTFVK